MSRNVTHTRAPLRETAQPKDSKTHCTRPRFPKLSPFPPSSTSSRSTLNTQTRRDTSSLGPTCNLIQAPRKVHLVSGAAVLVLDFSRGQTHLSDFYCEPRTHLCPVAVWGRRHCLSTWRRMLCSRPCALKSYLLTRVSISRPIHTYYFSTAVVTKCRSVA